MTIEQYNRKVSLLVGANSGDALDLSAFRIRFTIRRGDYQNPNICEIRVFNLTENTVSRIQGEFSRVILQGGYEGNFGILFDGTIIDRCVGRENNTDTYLDLVVSDGDRAYNYAMMAVSLAAGSTPEDGVQAILQQMGRSGVSRGYIPELPQNKSLRGEVFYGQASQCMREIANNLEMTWSIQDGKLTMIPLTAYVPGEVPVISPETGLIGMPTQTPNGIEMRVLLNPSIKIGQLIRLEHATVQLHQYDTSFQAQAKNIATAKQNRLNQAGLYYVMIADSVGDTRGQEWYSDLVCLAVDATVAPKAEILNQVKVNPVIAPIKRNG